LTLTADELRLIFVEIREIEGTLGTRTNASRATLVMPAVRAIRSRIVEYLINGQQDDIHGQLRHALDRVREL